MRINKNHVKALYRRGQSLRALGRLDEAQVDLKRLIKLEPSNSVARVSLEQLVQAQNAKAVRRGEVEDKTTTSITLASPFHIHTIRSWQEEHAHIKRLEITKRKLRDFLDSENLSYL